MSSFEKMILFLQKEMSEPTSFGWFHLMWLLFVILGIVILYERKKYYSARQLKLVIGIYGIVAVIFEILKQISWSFDYDMVTNVGIWDYQWYAFPFQLCTTPIYVSLLCLCFPKSKIRDCLFSYMAYVTLLGSIAVMIMPDSCLTTDVLVNIHTMWLHFGSFVVSIYLLMTNTVKVSWQSLKHGLIVFGIFLLIANGLNIIVYNLDVLKGETFNMFYVSPYFTSELPIFNVIQENVPYVLFLFIYVIAIILGATLVFGISCLFKKICKNKKKRS